MEILPLTHEHIPAAAELFTAGYRRLKEAVPAVSERLLDPAEIQAKLNWLVDDSGGTSRGALAALEDGRLTGYLGWILIDNFRRTGVRAALALDWAHAALPERQAQVYPLLYRQASQRWQAQGVKTHAITLLTHDQAVVNTWFWSGFGLAVVDAIRFIEPLGVQAPPGFTLRQATAADAAALQEIDREHCQHYAAAPVFMVTPSATTLEEAAEFVAQPGASYWLALDGKRLAAMLKFERSGDGSSEVVAAEDGIHCTGAYTRPEYRGLGLAPALLEAAQKDYAAQGFRRFSVDFEAFNPEAARFWMRYYQPVCFSLIRVPEAEICE